MRIAMYAGTSAALAAAVVTSAFYQRANFYSAMVYLSNSNLCLMILVNLIFLAYGSFMYGLQRLCFGTLRPVEVEQLYEKAWFAVTETCLAMTVFREEVGAFFLVMFTALITGKVWGWIGEGRVEVLEQQPPANPRLFHTRLVVSLVTSVVYNCWLLSYAINTVIAVAKPTMMVMFLFEFAVLAVGSMHTALRYVISLVEASVIKKQTRVSLAQRRDQVRRERDLILLRRSEGDLTAGQGEPLPDPDEVEEMDIEVPGWETKGQWVLFLDLLADLLKLLVYVAFFGVLLVFYGLPIHIMRDLFMTARSFVKRLSALLKYKQALRDMNRYADATAEELGREDTCIICREEMRPWDPDAGQLERHRPKKLPCGHILHFGCLKSWLERQQVCPTCRSSVTADQQQRGPNHRHRMAFHIAPNVANGQNQAGAAPGVQPLNGLQDAQLNGQAPQAGQQPGAARAAMRYINLGPIRLGFAQGGQEVAELANRMGVNLNDGNAQVAARPNVPAATPSDLSSMEAVRNRLMEVDQRIAQEIRDMQHGLQDAHIAQRELQSMNYMLNELARIRHSISQNSQQQQQAQNGQPGQALPHPPNTNHFRDFAQRMPPPMDWTMHHPTPPQFPVNLPAQFPHAAHSFATRMGSPAVVRHGPQANATAIPAGSPDLPEGVVLPQGWSLLPLQRLDQAGPVPNGSAPAPGASSVQAPGAPDSTYHSETNSTAHPPQPSTSVPTESNNHEEAPSHAPGPARSQMSTEPVGSPAVEVAAPTPVTPRWGGSAQLFSGANGGSSSSGSLPFGGGEQHPQAEASATSASPQPPAADGESSEGGGAASMTSSSSPKGKAPAASVEDAEDE